MQATPTDNQLFEKLTSGDVTAMQTLFERHYTFLCQVVYRIVKDSQLAEDVVQELFIQLWDKKADVQTPTNVVGYLRKSAVNRGINYLRDHKKWLEDNETPQEKSYEQVSAQEQLETLELSKEIDKAIQSLPEKCQLVFTLSRHEGLTYQEIATQLGISIKTVENQISKALKLLRGTLSRYLSFGLLFEYVYHYLS